MNPLEIVNLIISILSLLATIAVSFVIYFLERKNSKKQRANEIKESAKRFIAENAEERGFLPWAVIASGCFPQNRHVRRIYNEFTLLEDDVKREVLSQVKMDIPLIIRNEWIDEKISLVIEASNQLGLGNSFLYDGAKYFHRIYDYKESEFNKSSLGYYSEDFEDVFGIESNILFKRSGFIPFSRYIGDYLYLKYKDPGRFDAKWSKPFDALLQMKQIRETPDESFVCAWTSIIVEETISYAQDYLGYIDSSVVDTDSQPETFEDRYFQILYQLYFFNEKQPTKHKHSKIERKAKKGKRIAKRPMR